MATPSDPNERGQSCSVRAQAPAELVTRLVAHAQCTPRLLAALLTSSRALDGVLAWPPAWGPLLQALIEAAPSSVVELTREEDGLWCAMVEGDGGDYRMRYDACPGYAIASLLLSVWSDPVEVAP